MKIIYLIALLAVTGGGTLRAQTNAPAAPKPSRAPTLIDSDRADFDLTARRALYYGNVRVDDPQMKLTCEKLTADLPPSGGRISRIVAETNVVMDSTDEKGQIHHATSDKAVYEYSVQNGVTNETVTLSGHAMMENAQGWLTGEPIVWDRVNNRLSATNQKMLFRQSPADAVANTNAPAAKTNSPPGMPAVPVATTNVPPGVIPTIQLSTNFPPGVIRNLDRTNQNSNPQPR